MKTTQFLKDYLSAIGFEQDKDYQLTESQDTIGYLFVLTIRADHPKIGILKGRKGRNLKILKQILRVVGLNEKINPFLIIKLNK
ncbi:MAG: hypothetical protein QW469_00430 [Candidatus Aenigmatarchaeota archaeon]